MSSPRIAELTQEGSGVLQGKTVVSEYWRRALLRSPQLRFTLVGTYVGADSVALAYRGAGGPAVEVFFFNPQGLVCRASALYVP